jgi:outer membrane receptor for ferrienterochelin and colicins
VAKAGYRSGFLILFWLLHLLPAVTRHATAQHALVQNDSGRPVAGAHLVYRGTGPAWVLVSDAGGWLKLPRQEAATIEVSAIGHIPTEIRITGREDTLRIMLKKSMYDLNEVVITALHEPKAASESIVPIRSIGYRELRARGAVNALDVLRQELGFQISNDAILGSSAAMLGLSGENVKILIDGVPVIGRLNGNIDLAQINVHQIERIEMVQGPLAVNFGTNALAGTINFITRKPEKGVMSLFGETFAETSGHYNIQAGFNASHHHHAMRFQAGRNYFDGWHPRDRRFFHRRTPVADASRFQLWNPREQQFLNAAYTYSFQKTNIRVRGEHFDETITNRGRPMLPYLERALDDRYRTRRTDGSVHLESPIGNKAKFQALAALNQYTRYKHTYIADLTGVNYTLSDQPGTHDTTTFTTWLSRGSINVKPHHTLSTQWGYEVEREKATGRRIEDPTGVIANYALFTTAEYTPNTWLSLRPGLRLAHNSRFRAPIVPSVHVLVSPHRKYTVRFNYSQGFRSPGLKELSFYFVDINHNIIGNSKLRAEQSHHFSAMIEQPVESKKPGWQLSAFYNQVYNMISLALAPDGVTYSYFNLDNRRTTGVQCRANYQIGAARFEAGVLRTGVSNQLEQRSDVPPMNFFIETTFSSAYTFEKYGITAHLYHKYNGRREFFILTADGNVATTFIGSFHTADATLEKNLKKGRYTAAIGARNFLDVDFVEAGSTVNNSTHGTGGGPVAMGVGRTWFIRLSANISKP